MVTILSRTQCRKKSPATGVAFLGVFTIAMLEETWKEATGKYATLEQLAEGYEGKVAGGTVTLGPMKFEEEGTDPRRLPGYEFSLNLSSSGDRLEVYQTPQKPGLPGFFIGGEKIYCNLKGRASSRDTLLGTTFEIFGRLARLYPSPDTATTPGTSAPAERPRRPTPVEPSGTATTPGTSSPPQESVPAAGGQPQVSLGELARQLRQKKQSQRVGGQKVLEAEGTAPKKVIQTEDSEGLGDVPSGFTRFEHPEWGYSVLLPPGAERESRDPTAAIAFRVLWQGSKVEILLEMPILLREEEFSQPKSLLDQAEQWKVFPDFVLSRQVTTINGKPARLLEYDDPRSRGLVVVVVAPSRLGAGRGLAVFCMGPDADYSKFESMCRTVVESVRAQ